MTPIDAVAWPAARAYELLHRLCEHAGLARDLDGAVPSVDPARLGSSVPFAARQLGLETRTVRIPHDPLVDGLGAAAPALLRVDRGAEVALVGVVRRRGGRLAVVGRDGGLVEIDGAELRAWIAPPSAVGGVVVPTGRDTASRLLALAEPVSAGPEPGGSELWEVRASPGAPLWRQAVGAGLHRAAAALVALHVVRLGLVGGSWWILGSGAVHGDLDGALLAGWALVLGTGVAVTAVLDAVQGHLLLEVNVRYRRKILYGATKVSPNVPRAIGAGALLGRVFEAEAVDTLAVSAGIAAVTSAADLAFTAALFLAIPGAGGLSVLLVGWLALVVAGGGWLFGRQRAWTLDRIAMSEQVVESVLGRRTRLAQLGPARFLPAEDRTLERYVQVSAAVDRAETGYEAAAGRGWLAVGLVSLAMTSSGLGPGQTAAALGGVLMGYQALTRVAGSVHLVAALALGWRQARVLYAASSEPELPGVPAVVERDRANPVEPGSRSPLLRAEGLGFRPHPSRRPVLDDVSVGVAAGERILLTGPSGGGKSTLARLLSGLQPATAGTVVLRGLNRRSLGELEWARRVAYVPPFGDNHVFSATFAYNLMPGRWPPSVTDRGEAEQVCHELGLGPLLDRMPGGLDQVVGETGWRLSHGERSRVFLARALLQRPEVIVLDESFGALDAETCKECLECVLRRSPALVVISHA